MLYTVVVGPMCATGKSCRKDGRSWKHEEITTDQTDGNKAKKNTEEENRTDVRGLHIRNWRRAAADSANHDRKHQVLRR